APRSTIASHSASPPEPTRRARGASRSCPNRGGSEPQPTAMRAGEAAEAVELRLEAPPVASGERCGAGEHRLWPGEHGPRVSPPRLCSHGGCRRRTARSFMSKLGCLDWAPQKFKTSARTHRMEPSRLRRLGREENMNKFMLGVAGAVASLALATPGVASA